MSRSHRLLALLLLLPLLACPTLAQDGEWEGSTGLAPPPSLLDANQTGWGWNGSCPAVAEPATVRHPTLTDKFGDALGAWVGFLFVTIAASQCALLVRYISLPLITGYMAFGVLVGPQVLSMASKEDLTFLQPITHFALAFISLSAGAELYLPELRALFRRIVSITALVTAICFVVCLFAVWGLAAAGMVPFMQELSGSCQFSVSLLASCIMVTQSPSSAIAVVQELRAKGSFTSTFLGITVLTDIVVLLIYSLCSSIANANCNAGGDGFRILDLALTLLCIGVAGILGYLFGKLIIFLIWLPRMHGEWLVLPLGYCTFALTEWFIEYSTEHWGHGLNFDALLICIFAGYVVANQSRNRRKFLRFMGVLCPYVFIPFFTLTGAALNLSVIFKALGFAVIIFLIRAATFLGGSVLGARYSGMDSKHTRTLWIAMLTQAGVSLGIAAEVVIAFPAWGQEFHSTVVAVILINQVIGPIACKWAIRANGEDGLAAAGEHDEEDEAATKRCVLLGINISSLGVAQRLLRDGWNVLFVDTDASKAHMLQWLAYEKRTKLPLSKEEIERRNRKAQLRAEALPPSDFVDLDPPSAASAASAASAESAPEVELARPATYATPSPDPSPSIDAPLVGADAVDSSSSAVPAPASDADLLNTTTPPDERQVQFRLLSLDGLEVASGDPLAHLSYARESVALRHLLADCSAANVQSALVMLESDQLNFDLCAVLLDVLHLPRVVVEVQNPLWAGSFAALGVLPVFPYSLSAHTLHSLVSSVGAHEAPQLLDPRKPLHVSVSNLIGPDTLRKGADEPALYLRHLSSRQQAQFAAQHPDPPMPLDKVWKMDEKVRVVSAAAREEYLSQIRAAGSNLAVEWGSRRDRARQSAQQTFSGPGMMLSSTGGHDDDDLGDDDARRLREAREQEKQRRREEKSRREEGDEL